MWVKVDTIQVEKNKPKEKRRREKKRKEKKNGNVNGKTTWRHNQIVKIKKKKEK